MLEVDWQFAMETTRGLPMTRKLIKGLQDMQGMPSYIWRLAGGRQASISLRMESGRKEQMGLLANGLAMKFLSQELHIRPQRFPIRQGTIILSMKCVWEIGPALSLLFWSCFDECAVSVE